MEKFKEIETKVLAFYGLYFIWLSIIIALSPTENVLNIFTSIVAFFYLLLLREKDDLTWFFGTCIFIFLGTSIEVANFTVRFSEITFADYPFWLPIAWGTTVLALRKFYVLMKSAENED